jgi:hypothetical protein
LNGPSEVGGGVGGAIRYSPCPTEIELSALADVGARAFRPSLSARARGVSRFRGILGADEK